MYPGARKRSATGTGGDKAGRAKRRDAATLIQRFPEKNPTEGDDLRGLR